MGKLTGEDAAMDGVTCLRKFQVTSTAIPARAICSVTGGGVAIAKGNEDGRGVAHAWGAQPFKLPGEKFTFEGADRDGSGITGPAIIDRTEIFADVENGNRLWHRIWFSQEGSGGAGWVYGPLVVADTGQPSNATAQGLGVKVDNVLFSVRNWRLVLVAANAVMNDTDTDGFTGRDTGNKMAFFEYMAWYNDHADLPAIGSFKELEFQTTDTLEWVMDYGYIRDVDTDISIEGDGSGKARGNIAKISGEFSIAEGTVIGTLIAPDSTVWYP